MAHVALGCVAVAAPVYQRQPSLTPYAIRCLKGFPCLAFRRDDKPSCAVPMEVTLQVSVTCLGSYGLCSTHPLPTASNFATAQTTFTDFSQIQADAAQRSDPPRLRVKRDGRPPVHHGRHRHSDHGCREADRGRVGRRREGHGHRPRRARLSYVGCGLSAAGLPPAAIDECEQPEVVLIRLWSGVAPSGSTPARFPLAHPAPGRDARHALLPGVHVGCGPIGRGVRPELGEVARGPQFDGLDANHWDHVARRAATISSPRPGPSCSAALPGTRGGGARPGPCRSSLSLARPSARVNPRRPRSGAATRPPCPGLARRSGPIRAFWS